MVQVARTRPTFINNMDVSSTADTVTNIGSPGMQAYTSANTEPGATCPKILVLPQISLQEITARIVKTREHTKQVLAEMGFRFPDSKSNFLFVTHPDCDAHELFEALREAHIFVRWFDSPRIRNYLRITIGTDAQMESLFAFLRAYLKK